MTTVKPSPASRSATAAPMPREAPVTIATLLVSFGIFSLLMISRQVRVWWDKARPFQIPDNQALSGITIRQRRTIQMDRFDAMRVFTRQAEILRRQRKTASLHHPREHPHRSFTLAAEDLGL